MSANYFILSHGTMANSRSPFTLVNEVHEALGLHNNSVICNAGAGSDLLGLDFLGLSTGPTWSGHKYIQRTAKKVLDEIRLRKWDETGNYILVGFSRGCMLSWQILYEFFYGGKNFSRAFGVNRDNVHVLSLDPAYGILDPSAGYYRELRLGQHYVRPENITEVYMLNASALHKFIKMYDTPTYVAGINRYFLPGNHEELAETSLTPLKKMLFGDGWLDETSLQPYGRKYLRSFLHDLGVTWYNPQTGSDLDWLSMYAQFKLSKDHLRGNWGSTERPKLVDLYNTYRQQHGLGDSGFFINPEDRELFKQHARMIFTGNHESLFHTLAWRGEARRSRFWLRTAASVYDDLRRMGAARAVYQSVVATVIEHLKHRVP